MARGKVRYHLSPDGPRICKADKQVCKYGEEEHGYNLQEMTVKYELKMEKTINLAKALEDSTNNETKRGKLKQLSRHKDLRVRRGVAENPNVTTEILDKLAEDEDKMLKSVVASNPKTSEKVLTALSKDDDLLVAHKAIANPNIPKEDLNHAAVSGSLFKKVAAASNSSGNLSEAAVDELLKTRDASVGIALMKNPTVDRESKTKAVQCAVTSKYALTDNETAPEAIKRAWYILVDTGKVPQSTRFLNHPNTPKEVFENMKDFELYRSETRDKASQKL